LDEVDDTSILKTGRTARYRRSLFRLPPSQMRGSIRGPIAQAI
jgi:hypothetical protein